MCCDQFMLFLRILEVLGTLLVGVAAFFAWRGWKREIHGQTEYKLALNLLVKLHKYRDAIDSARSRMRTIEIEIEIDKDGDNPVKDVEKYEGMRRTYKKRWERTLEAQQTIYDNLQSAEVIWGEEVKNLFQDLFNHSNKLLWAIEEYLDFIDPSLSGLTEKLSKETNAILHKPHREEDKFNNELQRLITEIDNYLKPKLKSSGWIATISGWIKAVSRKIIGSGGGT